MRPDQCGTFGVPPGHPAYDAVQTFDLFLREHYVLDQSNEAACAAFRDRWGDYMAGDAPGPTVTEAGNA